MDGANWWLIDIIGPAILLIVLILLVIQVRPIRNGSDDPAPRQRRDGADQR